MDIFLCSFLQTALKFSASSLENLKFISTSFGLSSRWFLCITIPFDLFTFIFILDYFLLHMIHLFLFVIPLGYYLRGSHILVLLLRNWVLRTQGIHLVNSLQKHCLDTFHLSENRWNASMHIALPEYPKSDNLFGDRISGSCESPFYIYFKQRCMCWCLCAIN